MLIKWQEWRFSFKLAWDDRKLRWLSMAMLAVLILVTFFVLWIILSNLSTDIVVSHYTVYLGIDQMVPLSYFVLMLVVPIFLYILVVFLAFLLYKYDYLATYALLLVSVLTEVLWLIQLFYLIKINT